MSDIYYKLNLQFSGSSLSSVVNNNLVLITWLKKEQVLLPQQKMK